jgi:hypothetical protein
MIRPDRVHGSLYRDSVVFAMELERIWYRTWVYVGHESEVPRINDYVAKSIGPQTIIILMQLMRCTSSKLARRIADICLRGEFELIEARDLCGACYARDLRACRRFKPANSFPLPWSGAFTPQALP